MSAPHTVVVGGGVVGLACAHALRKRNHRVTVLERHDFGAGCSWGNAGWIVPTFSAPLATPGLTWKALGWMMRADSPFHLSLRSAPSLAGWLWQFWRHCNPRDFERGVQALARFSSKAMQSFDALAADGVRFESHRSGVLFAFLDESELAATQQRLSKLGEWGCAPPKLLRGAELRAAEPALGANVVGGLHVASERHVRPDTLTQGLRTHLLEAGVELRSSVDVLDWVVRDGRIVSVQTTAGVVQGDHFVLAAGVHSGALGARLGVNLPLQAGKGYSITFDTDLAKLRQPLDLAEAGIVCSPFASGWRIAGTMELSGINEQVNQARVDMLRRGVRRYLDLPATAVAGGVEWMGQRPLTPDGLPIIGRMPRYMNGYVAAGHAMLGITLAPVTAQLIANCVTQAPAAAAEFKAFDPARFA